MNNSDKPRSPGNRITLEGDTITIGETKFPIHQIRYVDVASHLPRRFWLLASISLALFLLTGASMFGVAIISIFLRNADPHIVAWILGLIFTIGGAAFFGISIFAMIAYPGEWRVEVATREGIVTVQVERSRTRAVIFADRLSRLLADSYVPFE